MSDRWWYLDLVAEFPDLEIYYGGWGPEQETMQLELGERAMLHETDWLLTWIYTSPRDKHWAAVSGMFGMVLQAMRECGKFPEFGWPVPDGWRPDAKKWDSGQMWPKEGGSNLWKILPRGVMRSG